MNFSLGGGQSRNVSKELNANEVATYYQRLNALSGGRLNALARKGTTPVQYTGMSTDQLRALGGAGASREAAATQARAQAVAEINSDPNLSVAQQQRAKQINDTDYNARMDAIKQETEAMLSSTAQEEAARQYESRLKSSEIDAKDLELLAKIYFGGKGTYSSGSSWNMNMAGGFGK